MSAILDRQKTSLAGELFVAAELLKRGYQVSLTLGNAKSVDLLVYDDTNQRTFAVQVKALRSPNYFDLEPAKVVESHVYVFALLNAPGEPVDFFVVWGRALLADKVNFFGKTHETSKRNGIARKALGPFKNNWGAFLETAP